MIIEGLVALAFSAILSALTCLVLIRLAKRKSIFDSGDGVRKLQESPTPFFGGVSVFLCLSIAAIVSLYFLPWNSLTDLYVGVFAPAAILFAVGLLDDFWDLSPYLRLLIQSAAATIASLFLFNSGLGVALSPNRTVNLLLTIIWTIAITNSFNLIDNHDLGLVTALIPSLFCMATFAYIFEQRVVFVFTAVVLGSLIGFAFWNKPPAKLYMGDSGALLLGFFIAMLTLRLRPEVSDIKTSALIPVAILIIFVLDTTLVVLDRIRKGKSPLLAGRDHISHRIVKVSQRPRIVPICYLIFGTLNSALLLLLTLKFDTSWLFMVTIYFTISALIIRRLIAINT